MRNRLLAANEAQRLTDFVYRLYGDSYPNDVFYQAERIAQLILSQQLFCGIAERDDNTIVGHLATYFEHGNDTTADGISGMVDPDARGANIMSSLAGPMMPMYEQRKLAGLHLYSVTLHPISQRISVDGGAVITGLLTRDWPGQYQVAGFEEGVGLERMPMVTMYMPFYRDHLQPRVVYCPSALEACLKSIYQQLDYPRVMEMERAKPHGTSAFSIIEKPRQGCATLRFGTLGSDALIQVSQFTEEQKATAAIYVDLPLTDTACSEVCNPLLDAGWRFGALLPERSDTDFLRLQIRQAETGWDSVSLIPETEPFQSWVS